MKKNIIGASVLLVFALLVGSLTNTWYGGGPYYRGDGGAVAAGTFGGLAAGTMLGLAAGRGGGGSRSRKINRLEDKLDDKDAKIERLEQRLNQLESQR